VGVVLDTRNAWARLEEIVRMCDGAGIDALWAWEDLGSADGEPRLEAWTALTLCAREAAHPRVGAVLTPSFRPPALVAAMAATLDSAIGGRLELGLSRRAVPPWHPPAGSDPPAADPSLAASDGYAEVLRDFLASIDRVGSGSPQPGGPPLSIEATTEAEMDEAARVADDVLVRATAVRNAETFREALRGSCERAGRDPSTLGVAVAVPVSVGRTVAEAQARADAEPWFRAIGPLREVAVFGTLERCQERVIELAHAGVTDLRCVIPNTPDVHDVIAQLTAIAIGTPDVLAPGAPRSKSPDPPKTWGGRPTRK